MHGALHHLMSVHSSDQGASRHFCRALLSSPSLPLCHPEYSTQMQYSHIYSKEAQVPGPPCSQVPGPPTEAGETTDQVLRVQPRVKSARLVLDELSDEAHLTQDNSSTRT